MSIRILQGHCIDVMRTLAAESVHTVVTSPPYWGLRDYGTEPVRWGDGWVGHLGLEPTPEAYVQHLLEVFREVRRVLHPEGTVWLNLGDCYATGAGSVGGAPGGGEQGARWRGDIYRDRDAKRRPRNDHAGRGHPAKADGSLADRKNVGPMTQPNRMPIPGLKPKDLVGIPWRVAFALQAEGWYLRNDIVWAKRNCMPESVRDRCTKSHEYIFLLTKNERYYYDSVAIEEEQEEQERTRRLREQVTGLDTTYELRRDQAHGQVAPGKNGVVRSAKARHDLAVKGTRNKRTVWFVGTKPFSEAHFATFPPELIEPCILAGTSEYGHCSACGGGMTVSLQSLSQPRAKAAATNAASNRWSAVRPPAMAVISAAACRGHRTISVRSGGGLAASARRRRSLVPCSIPSEVLAPRGLWPIGISVMRC